ncbi:MAG TPA: prephenate dehydratase [Candidatus Binatia bacterium]|nr:prephenate dehydratase [Candidatus Binatia bacterium]
MRRNESVEALRQKIDRIDAKVVNLLNDRAALAQKIGRSKSLSSQEVYVPHREKEVLQRITQLNRGPLSARAVQAVFREIISACRALEAPLDVAFFGAAATYTHLAAREKFGASVNLAPTSSIAEVFQAVSQERAAYGVVPIENSTEGVVAHTLDLLVESDLKICAEIFLDIHHHLLSRSGDPADVRKIVSHPQALAQCRNWLAHHFASVPVEEVASTAHAAIRASQDGSLAAISSAMAREVYGLQVVAANIEDQSTNITRFVVIGKTRSRPSGDDKTSLVFSVKDRPGVLHRMLQPFARRRINLTKIESRPIKNKPWEYMFFLDLCGHCEERAVGRAIAALEKNCLFLKILGSYPNGR